MMPSTSVPRTLDDWLAYAESVHPVGIDMGLERVGRRPLSSTHLKRRRAVR